MVTFVQARSTGNDSIVSLLLAHPDIDVNHKSKVGSPVIPLLLAHPDINVNVKDGDGCTPFYLACCGRPPVFVRC